MKKNRILGLDIVRTVAIFFVIGVHFFLNTSFYETPVQGNNMFVQLGLRWTFYMCVPLFLLLTGYLQCKKELNKSYYKSLISILAAYVFIGVISIVFKIEVLQQEKSLLEWVMSLFNFTSNAYAWYVEMYVGLFLIIPFLNLIYNNLNDIKKKKILIATLVFLTSVSSFVVGFKINQIDINIVPDYWTIMYPITYYFIGCFIREFKFKVNKVHTLALLLGVLFIETVLSYISIGGGGFNWVFDGFGCLPTLICAVLLFILLYDIDLKNKLLRFLISSISKVSFEMYLFSYIFDNIVYHYIFKQYFQSQQQFLIYIIVTVPLVFILAYIASKIKEYLFAFIKKYRK